VGLRRSLDVILSGKLHPAKVAFKKGLVTHLVPQQAATALAAKLACQPRPKPVRHWDCLPGIAHLIAKLATRQVLKQTRGHYPAPLAAVDVMLKSLRLTVEEGLALGRATMVQLAQTPVAGHLIDLFFLREAANKSRPASGHALPITHAAVIGAGVMGSGIAQTLVTRGVNTLLTDVQPSAIGRGVQQIRDLTAKAAARRVFTSKQAREALDRLNTAHTAVPLHRYGLIIEAATENLELKKKIFADLAARCGADSILATNTSALSVSALAATVPNPERVNGLHSFNPVHKMPLVEIITLPETSADVIATATAFVQGLGKTPVLVKDSPGFVVNRILMPYLMEAVHLHETGTDAATIDHTMLAFGMPMGPLRLLDEIGLDVAQHVADTLSTAFPERFRPSNLLREKIAAGQLGRKSGRGFYDYHGGRPRRDRVERIDPEIQQRLSHLITDEAQRCLDENLTARASDINLAMILGTGYPPFTGGPLNNI
jgi:3-hydroxyacyl-CoA dehydrogenase/enoyl-CoA hydratase/3-hydroxybutyryl-CoA epimerase